ncbi:MAG: hypothetical protein U0527_16980 [Candidatus Eisenbacteria bacterium]
MARSYTFPGPNLDASFVEVALGFAVTITFAAVASLTWSGHLDLLGLHAARASLELRVLVAGASGLAALVGVLVGVRGVRGVTLALARRGGLLRVEKSVGTFRLRAEATGGWALVLEVDGPGIRFPLDEATAAELSRLFDPTDLLVAEWIDIPDEEGGPVILGLTALESESDASDQAAKAA